MITDKTREPSGRVVGLFLSPARREPMTSMETVRALKDYGLEGDAHARPNTSRQVLLIGKGTLDELGLRPGDLKENITVGGLQRSQMAVGSVVRIGTARFALTAECEPCRHVNELRPGLMQELVGRRGMLARVVSTGELKIGDPVSVDDENAHSDG